MPLSANLTKIVLSAQLCNTQHRVNQVSASLSVTWIPLMIAAVSVTLDANTVPEETYSVALSKSVKTVSMLS